MVGFRPCEHDEQTRKIDSYANVESSSRKLETNENFSDIVERERRLFVSILGDSTCGQRALYPLGMTGLPIVNVNNNCSTGTIGCRWICSDGK